MSKSRIPMLDLSLEIKEIWPDLQQSIEEVILSTEFINGPAVKNFEHEAAAYLGVDFSVGLNSGTDALIIALRTCGIKEGDEVITTPFTFFATAESISNIGAIPVLADIDPDTYNIDPSKIEEKISSRTKAIIPVHLFGHACDMKNILATAMKHGLAVIEDAAQAFGGAFEGQKLGTLGDVGTYSFFPSKNLGAFGDGGMLVTRDEKKAVLAQTLRNHGGLNKYKNMYFGYNSRLDSIQAAILSIRLRKLDKHTAMRRTVAAHYGKLLAGIDGVKIPVERPYTNHVFHQYTLRIGKNRRDRIQENLAMAGIDSTIYYPNAIHKLPVYAAMNCHLPVAELATEEVLSLPMGPMLDVASQVEIASIIKRSMG
jgi:dTDP-4-amino-4,6-dideoxygalactose transaminase